MVDNIEYTINSLAEDGHKEMTLVLHPMVEAFVTKPKGFRKSIVRDWRKKYGVKLTIEPSATVTFMEYHLLNKNGEELSV